MKNERLAYGTIEIRPTFVDGYWVSRNGEVFSVLGPGGEPQLMATYNNGNRINLKRKSWDVGLLVLTAWAEPVAMRVDPERGPELSNLFWGTRRKESDKNRK